MFKTMLKGILSAITIQLLQSYRHLSLQLLKIEAAKCYLHGVQMVRASALCLLRNGLAIGLIGVGVLLLHAGLFLLLPWTVKAKALLGILLGVGYIAIGCAALHAAMDEKTWMTKSGFDEMLEAATRPSPKD